MDYVLKKTYLGLALDAVIEQAGIEHMSKQLGELFKSAFMKNYEQLPKHNEPLRILGNEENLKESPIGFADQHSCFTVIAKQIDFRGHIEFLNNKQKATTCIEAFSDNKKRPTKSPKPISKKLKSASKLEKKARRLRRERADDDLYGEL